MKGLLNLVSSSHLIVITQREQVAQIRGKAVYAVRDVALISLISQAEASKTIENLATSARQQQPEHHDTDTELSDIDEDAESLSKGGNDEPPEAAAVEPPKGMLSKSTTFTKNVINDKGRYGRFAERWFSKNGSNATIRQRQGMSSEQDFPSSSDNQDVHRTSEDEDNVETSHATEEITAAKKSTAIESLSGRIQRTARLFFSTSGFYFSYDFDLSTRLDQNDMKPSETPLWKRFDPLVR